MVRFTRARSAVSISRLRHQGSGADEADAERGSPSSGSTISIRQPPAAPIRAGTRARPGACEARSPIEGEGTADSRPMVCRPMAAGVQVPGNPQERQSGE